MALLPEMLQHDEFAMLRHYLNDDTDKRKLFQLASRTADLYDQYLVYRSDWLIRWEAGELVEGLPEAQIWQAPLWKALVEHTEDWASLSGTVPISTIGLSRYLKMRRNARPDCRHAFLSAGYPHYPCLSEGAECAG
jgi:exonuclease V gamma subunit